MTYFGTFEIKNRVEHYMFQQRGYEIVSLVKAPDGIENSYMQQARANLHEEQTDHVAGLLAVRLPRLPDVN